MTIATQATLAALLAKTLTAPATEAKQDTGNTALASILTAVQAATPAGGNTIGSVINAAGSNSIGTVGLNAGSNPIGTVGAQALIVTGTITSTAGIIDGATDLAPYASVSVQLTGTFTGSVTFQVSNDGTNWSNKILTQAASGAGPTLGSVTIAAGDIGARYFRVNGSNWASGTMNVTIRYSSQPSTQNQNLLLGSNSNLIGGVFIGTGSTPSAFSTSATASTNATSVKTSAGTLFEVTVSNPTAGDAYFKLYNKASAPTVGTDTPIYMEKVATGATISRVFGANGKRFTTGIGWALTGAASSGDTTVVANAGVLVHGTYA